jgi:hypothetical protein
MSGISNSKPFPLESKTMKKLIAILLIGTQAAMAATPSRFGDVVVKGSASVGTNSQPVASAALDVVSTTKGARPCPPMTQTQRDAIASPATGLCVYNTTTNAQNAYNGTAWVAVGSGSGFGDQRLTNGDFEGGTSNWTASAGTFTTQATTLFAGNASGKWVLSAATGSLSQDMTPAVAIPGVNLEASCWVNTTATTLQLCSRQGGVEIQCMPLPSTGTWQKVSLNMAAPSSGSIGVGISTTGSTTGTVYPDQCYVGSATNLAQLSQARDLGSLLYPTTSGCQWDITQTTYAADFPAQASCPTPTVTGSVSAPATKIPAASLATVGIGTLYLDYSFNTYMPASQYTSCRILDESGNQLEDVGLISSNETTSNKGAPQRILARAVYTTGQSNKTYKVQCKSSGGQVSIYANTAGAAQFDAQFSVKATFFPSSQIVYGPDATAASWSGYQTVSSGWATTSASLGDPSAGSGIALTQTTNRNFGTVANAGSSLPGITWTPPKTGMFKVCASVTIAASASQTPTIRIVDGSGTVIAPGLSQSISGANDGVISECGDYLVSSTAAVTSKIQLATNSGTATITNGVPAGAVAIQWSIAQLDAGQPAPLLTNAVTCGSTLCRVEAALTSGACSAGTCTMSTQTGGVSAASFSSAGVYTFTFSPSWPTEPACSSQSYAGAQNACNITSSSTSGVTVTCFNTSSGNPGNQRFGLNCTGTR